MHPQPTLIGFYRVSKFLLVLEAFNGVAWVIRMLILTLAQSNNGYQLINSLMILHFAIPTTLQNVVQQTRNNNSVLWWTFFPFFIGFGGDFGTLMEIVKDFPMNDGFKVYLLVSSIIDMLLTLSAIAVYTWYFVYPKVDGLPKDTISKYKYLNNY